MEDLLYLSIIPVKSFINNTFGHFFVPKTSKTILKYESLSFDIRSVHRVSRKREREKDMSLYVNTNINSLIAQRSLNSSSSSLQTAITRLSTGFKVNQAGDDAAGLCVAQGLDTQIRGNKRAMLNVEDGLNMMYIAEGGMSGVTEDLQRIRELCLQAANGIYSEDQAQTLMNEIKQRLEDIDVIANSTVFNGLNLANGSMAAAGKDVVLQSGSGTDEANNTINISSALTNMLCTALGIAIDIVGMDEVTTSLGADYLDPGTYDPANPPKVNGSNWDNASIRKYVEKLDAAIAKISEDRSMLGAYQNRLQSTSENLTVMNENYERSKSQIMDADMAAESANMVKYQVLQQTSAAMLAQANQIPSIALQLLGQ